MKNLSAPLLILGCVGLAGCSSDDDTPAKPQPIVDLRVDVNRDGLIALDDPADDDGEELWSAERGAVFLPNLDDDALACPRGAQVSGLTDDGLAGCRDSANEVVDGAEDAADLARLYVKPWPGAPDAAAGRIWVAPAAAEHVRLFRNLGDSWQVLSFVPVEGGAPSWYLDLTVADLRAGVEFGLEGRDFVRSTTGWSGLVDVHLDVQTASAGIVSDVVQMRVAPLLLSHHLQAAEQVFATRVLGFDNSAFHGNYDPAVETAQVPGGLIDNGQHDHWTQDWMEIGYATVPAPAGEQRRLDVFMRSANVERPGQPENALREAGREVYMSYHGMNAAGYTPPHAPGHSRDMDSLNSYGNTETIPPHAHAGVTYPLGRILRGSTPSFFPNPAVDDFLAAQRVQPTVFIDTSWLLVGHVDETISFLKSNSSLGFALLVNDPALAKKMLEDLVGQGHGDAMLFVGKTWINFDTNSTIPAQISVSGVLADTDVMAESKRGEVEVDAQLDALRAEVGIGDSDLIPSPFLHMSSYGVSVAYQPGTVNGQVLGDTHFATPRPHGPKIGGVDPFETQLTEALSQHGITVHYIENWDMLHRLSGEVHCGTNTKRAPMPGVYWWEAVQ
jgi:protein-arginine deiminase